MRKISRELRINERIRVREVRLIDENSEQMGVLPTPDALRIARERDLDLVEIAPNAVPPVCRLIDYGKFKYEQTKKEREARKNQKIVLLKEVRLTPKTDDHDIDFKSKMVQRFLEDGDKVKVTVRFKGREMAHPQLGRQVLDQISNNLKNSAVVERTPVIEGRTMSMILSPSAQSKAVASAAAAASAQLSERPAANVPEAPLEPRASLAPQPAPAPETDAPAPKPAPNPES